jgi:hypothetical protein
MIYAHDYLLVAGPCQTQVIHPASMREVMKPGILLIFQAHFKLSAKDNMHFTFKFYIKKTISYLG